MFSHICHCLLCIFFPLFFSRPGNLDKGICLYSESIVSRIIAEKQLSESLAKEFIASRSPIWAFKGDELKQQFNGEEQLRMLCVSWNMHGELP